MESVVVLASGGVNSTVVAAASAREARVNLLHVDHAQPSSDRERSAVESIAEAVGAERVLNIELAYLDSLSPAGQEQGKASVSPPAGCHPGPGLSPGLMPALLLAGGQWAGRIGASRVLCGASQVTDEADRAALPGEGGPDRRAEFFHAFNIMLETALPQRQRIVVETPLLDMTRTEAVRLGMRFNAPLAQAWCCHSGRSQPCGGCPGCQSAAAALSAVGLADPQTAPSV
ncbi:MAG: hypothetical protein GY842_23725 [bacterium]|nr:hypothetical protein [bacterium]